MDFGSWEKNQFLRNNKNVLCDLWEMKRHTTLRKRPNKDLNRPTARFGCPTLRKWYAKGKNYHI